MINKTKIVSLMLKLLICWFFRLSEMSWLTSPLVLHYAPFVSPLSAWSPPSPLCSHLLSPFVVWKRKRPKNRSKLSGIVLINFLFRPKQLKNWISMTGNFVYILFILFYYFFFKQKSSFSFLLTNDNTCCNHL